MSEIDSLDNNLVREQFQTLEFKLNIKMQANNYHN